MHVKAVLDSLGRMIRHGKITCRKWFVVGSELEYLLSLRQKYRSGSIVITLTYIYVYP